MAVAAATILSHVWQSGVISGMDGNFLGGGYVKASSRNLVCPHRSARWLISRMKVSFREKTLEKWFNAAVAGAIWR